MKKVKKNNKPLITLLVGLLISGLLIGFSVYSFVSYNKYAEKSYVEFLETKEKNLKDCEESIKSKNQEITNKEAEIDAIEREITLLQREKSEEFMNSRGWSDRYYELEDKITDKRKEQTKKRSEITTLRREVTNLESMKVEIEKEYGDYRYEKPIFRGITPFVPLGLGIFGIIITFIASATQKAIKEATRDLSYSEFEEVDEAKLSGIDVNDGVVLKKELSEKVESLLLASSSGDYDTIRKLCTKNMAKSYIDEVELLKKHNKKLFIKDIEFVGSKISNVFKNQNVTKVSFVVKVKMFNYTKSLSTNEIVLGDSKKKMVQAFRLTFVKEFLRGHNVKKCPNCGANVKESSRVDCQYCGTVFDNSNYDWYLESKVIINEE